MMRLKSLQFAGYRSFAARTPSALARGLQQIGLSPLTILFGKNNSGKSSAGRVLLQTVAAMAAGGDDPMPMTWHQLSFGERFRDVQHNGAFFSPLDLNLSFIDDDLSLHTIETQLNRADDSQDKPSHVSFSLDGIVAASETRYAGLLPDTEAGRRIREGARVLLDNSCHLGPLRETVAPHYDLGRRTALMKPDTPASLVELMLEDSDLKAAIAEWTSANMEGWAIEAQRVLQQGSLIARKHGREVNLAYSGQGLQQVLPVVALCKWRTLRRGGESYLDFVEQPELHLHDAAHAPLGDLFLEASRNATGNIVVETHSESLILRLRLRVAEGMDPSALTLLYVDETDDGSQVTEIKVDRDGEVDNWPKGIFSEAFEEIKAIRAAQRNRRGIGQ